MNKSTLAMIFLIMCLIAWVFLIRPTTLGGSAAYIIISGKSMQPTLSSGALVVTRSCSDYQVGDIVAFNVEGGTVVHRLIAKTEDGRFITRGDNNAYNDPWVITKQDIIGRRFIYMQGGGKILINILNSFRQPLYLVLYGICITIIFLVFSGFLIKPRRNKAEIIKQRRKYFHKYYHIHGRTV